MIRLEREGVIERLPRRGCVVRSLEKDDIEQLIDCRKLIECLILKEFFSSLDLKKFKTLSEKLKAARKKSAEELREAVFAADEEIHELIIAACGNRYLAGQVTHLKLLCRPYRALRCSDQEDADAILSEREKIIGAVLDGSVKEAVKMMSEHFECSKRFYLDPETGLI